MTTPATPIPARWFSAASLRAVAHLNERTRAEVAPDLAAYALALQEAVRDAVPLVQAAIQDALVLNGSKPDAIRPAFKAVEEWRALLPADEGEAT